MGRSNQGFGVFAWTGGGRYYIPDAVKLYKSYAAAEKWAEQLTNEQNDIYKGGFVVRTLAHCLEGTNR